MALNQNIDMIRGDDEAWDITLTDSGTGLPIDLTIMTGIKIWFTVKAQFTDTTYLLQKTSDLGGGITVVNPTGGIVRVAIASEDTKKFITPVTFKYDIQFRSTIGKITTLVIGNLTINSDLTLETT